MVPGKWTDVTLLPDAKRLAELGTLDPALLYVFVSGPGVGEGVAIAFPGTGWLFVDGCKTRGAFPLQELLKKFSRSASDKLVGMVLTHPHQDHAWGVADALERLSPPWVGVTGADSDKPSIAHEYEALAKKADPRVTSNELRSGVVRTAIRALLDLDHIRPGAVLRLHAGQPLPVQHHRVSITVQAPKKELLEAFVKQLVQKPDLVDAANEVSTVLEIEFGKCRIVLGADLPTTQGSTVVETGWDEVMSRCPQLAAHHGLKLPHHGSAGAFHDKLCSPATDRRSWWLTPYNSSRLPRVADLDGLPRLLEQEPSVHLTALPASKKLQQQVLHPGRVSLDQIGPNTTGTKTGIAFLDRAVVVGRPTEPGPLEPIWAAAFDGEGRMLGRWRGDVAFEIVAGTSISNALSAVPTVPLGAHAPTA